jgi:hypothetical protein
MASKKEPKFVQIAAASGGGLCALSEDGTVWVYVPSGGGSAFWRPVSAVRQAKD